MINIINTSFIKKQNLLFWSIATIVLVLYDITPRIDGFDTPYYFSAGENFWNGTIDCLRTPAYPLLLKLFYTCFGNYYGVVCIVILQSIIYLVSVNSLRNITKYTIKNQSIRTITSFLYIVCVAPGWCNELMTESLSISGCVILTDLVCRYIQKSTWQKSFGIFLISELLVFLRPSFIFLFAILPVVWVILWIRKSFRSLQILSFALSILCTTSFLGYCKAYEKEYGVFTSSISFVCNDIYNLKRSNSWNIEKVSNPQAKNILSQIDEQWCGNYAPIYTAVSSDHKNLKYIAIGCNEMKHSSKTALLQHRIEIYAASFDKRFNASVNTHTPLSAILFGCSLFLALPLSIFYSVVVISCLALIIYLIRKRRVPLMAMVLILFTTAQCVGIVLYASEAHERLLLPVYPLFLVLLGMAFEKATLIEKPTSPAL